MHDRSHQTHEAACRESSIRLPPAIAETKEDVLLSELFVGEEENLALFSESGSCTSKENSIHRPSWQGSCGSFTGDGLLDLNGSYSVCSNSDCGDILGAKNKFAKLKFAAKRPQIVGSTLVLDRNKQSGSPRKRQHVSKQAIANRLLRSDSELSLLHRCDEVLFQGGDDYTKSKNSPRRPRRTSLIEAIESNDTMRPPVRRTSNSNLPSINLEHPDSRPAPPSRTRSPVDRNVHDKLNTDSTTMNTSTEISISGHPLSPRENSPNCKEKPLLTSGRRRAKENACTVKDGDKHRKRRSASRGDQKEPSFFNRRRTKTTSPEKNCASPSVGPSEPRNQKKAKSESFRLFEKDFWHPKQTGSLVRLASRWKEGDDRQQTQQQPKDVAPKSPSRRKRTSVRSSNAGKSRDSTRPVKSKKKKAHSKNKSSDTDRPVSRTHNDDPKCSTSKWTSRIRRYKSKRSNSLERATLSPTTDGKSALMVPGSAPCLERVIETRSQERDTPPKSPLRATS